MQSSARREPAITLQVLVYLFGAYVLLNGEDIANQPLRQSAFLFQT